MTSEERVRDISRYLGESELTCRKCGSVLHVEEVEIEMRVGKRGNPIFRAICPDCGAFIKRMRNSKTEKIFWRGSTHEIAKLETSLLIWMLSVEYIKSARVVDLVRQHLKGRIVTNKTVEPMSMMEQREITTKKEIRGLRIRLAGLEHKVELGHHNMIVNAHRWDAVKMGAFITKDKELKRLMREVNKDILVKEETLEL